jgi:hypothetical protein
MGEGNTATSVSNTFRPLFERLSAATAALQLDIICIGPEVICHKHIAPPGAGNEKEGSMAEESHAMRVHFLKGCYHESGIHESAQTICKSGSVLSICFNAGIWGYDSWELTMRKILLDDTYPLVITSYNQEEAEDDFDTIQGWGIADQCQCHWTHEPNPHSFTTPRPRRSFDVREMVENAYWQCLQKK